MAGLKFLLNWRVVRSAFYVSTGTLREKIFLLKINWSLIILRLSAKSFWCFWANKFWQCCQICILLIKKIILEKNVFKKFIGFSAFDSQISGLRAKFCSAGLSKLHYTCPEKHFGVLKKCCNLKMFTPIWQIPEQKVYILMDFRYILHRKEVI